MPGSNGLVIPVGAKGLLFTPDALQAAAAAAIAQTPEGHTHTLVGSVDATGAKATVVLSSEDQRWKVVGAFQHEWTGANQAGASVIYSW